MQVVSHDVIEPLSQTRVIFQDPSETTPTVRPKFWANVQVPSCNSVTQFRHVTAGTKQVRAEPPQRPLTGFFGQHSGRSPSIHERFCSTCYLTAQWTLVIFNLWSTVTVLGRCSAPRVVD